MYYKVSTHGVSDRGLVRQNNEDYWAHPLDSYFFVLADGMGGHQAGEVASKESVESLCALFKERLQGQAQTLQASMQLLGEVIREVNCRIFRMGLGSVDLKGMGTTLCCVYLHKDGVIYGHVGDSRIYRYRDNKLVQLTRDHSLFRELLDLGKLNGQQAQEFVHKNIITKAIGTEPVVEPVVHCGSIHARDLILMCTDGLTDLLSHAQIESILASHSDDEVAQQLVNTAKEKGGYDNITVIAIKIQEKYVSTDLS